MKKELNNFPSIEEASDKLVKAMLEAMGIAQASNPIQQSLQLEEIIIKNKGKIHPVDMVQKDLISCWSNRGLEESDVFALELIDLSPEEKKILQTYSEDQSKLFVKLTISSMIKLMDTLALFIWADGQKGVLSTAEVQRLVDKDKVLN